MQKLNFWVPLQEPKWHTPVRPLIHLNPPPRNLRRGVTHRPIKRRFMSTFQDIKTLGLWYLKTVYRAKGPCAEYLRTIYFILSCCLLKADGRLNCDLISQNTAGLRDYEKRRKVFHCLRLQRV